MPALSYRGVPVEVVAGVIGGFARATVCLASDVRGTVDVSTTGIEPWPRIVQAFAHANALTVTFTNEVVVFRKAGPG